jgi:hypothetical protein
MAGLSKADCGAEQKRSSLRITIDMVEAIHFLPNKA